MKKHNENICPICGHDDLEWGSYEAEFGADSYLSMSWNCPKCETSGYAIYNLIFSEHSGIVEVK